MSTRTSTRTTPHHPIGIRARLARVLRRPVARAGVRPSRRSRALAGAQLVGGILATAACLAGLAALIVIGIGPHSGRYQVMAVLSNSMEPSFSAGDMIVVTPGALAGVGKGDVIAYHAPIEGRPLVTHRVVQVVKGGRHPVVRTKGDANHVRDPWQARLTSEPAWTYRATIPHAGRVVQSLRRPALRGALAYGAPLLLVGIGLVHIWRPAPASGNARVDMPGAGAVRAAGPELELQQWEDEGGAIVAMYDDAAGSRAPGQRVEPPERQTA